MIITSEDLTKSVIDILSDSLDLTILNSSEYGVMFFDYKGILFYLVVSLEGTVILLKPQEEEPFYTPLLGFEPEKIEQSLLSYIEYVKSSEKAIRKLSLKVEEHKVLRSLVYGFKPFLLGNYLGNGRFSNTSFSSFNLNFIYRERVFRAEYRASSNYCFVKLMNYDNKAFFRDFHKITTPSNLTQPNPPVLDLKDGCLDVELVKASLDETF